MLSLENIIERKGNRARARSEITVPCSSGKELVHNIIPTKREMQYPQLISHCQINLGIIFVIILGILWLNLNLLDLDLVSLVGTARS
jgi:hypothetical protein